jgi:hypothetical protein
MSEDLISIKFWSSVLKFWTTKGKLTHDNNVSAAFTRNSNSNRIIGCELV